MNAASLEDLHQRMVSQGVPAKQSSNHASTRAAVALSRFRPNLLIGGQSMAAYAEDSWHEVQIGRHVFCTAGKTSLNIVL